ncbi:hypothetical protein AB0N62_39210 [Streptomyces sp. NPDC093982]|uniref:hypothetical protein n=1 Tax=Streptomyces sp. NPDC093982 TaxID=3155077 RepID=UPI003434CCC4
MVTEEVYEAIALAESLHDSSRPHLFTVSGFPSAYQHFRSWVNGPAGQRLGLAPIPDGPVNLRMLRRSLAVELAYRPGGLLAAKVHLKHVSVVTTKGYANRPGGSQSRFLAEVGKEEEKRNLAIVTEEWANARAGIKPSGPGARDLLEFFHSVDGKLDDVLQTAPNVITNDQQVRGMLTKRAKTLHLGTANYCWFAAPAKALCLKLAGTPSADRPLIGMCDSARCPQATHHPRHRSVWEKTVEQNKVFIGMLGRGQKAERSRLEAELTRAEKVLADINAASEGPTAPAGTEAIRAGDGPAAGRGDPARRRVRSQDPGSRGRSDPHRLLPEGRTPRPLPAPRGGVRTAGEGRPSSRHCHGPQGIPDRAVEGPGHRAEGTGRRTGRGSRRAHGLQDLAISRLAAQHEEIERVQGQADAVGNVRHLPATRSGTAPAPRTDRP